MKNQTIKISAYDWDKTVYNGDSMTRFWFYMIWHRPWILFLTPYFIVLGILFALHIVPRQIFKEQMLILVHGIKVESLRKIVDAFWEKRRKNMFPDVIARIEQEKKEGYHLVCISASPRFLLEKIVAEIGFDTLICTELSVSEEGYQTNDFVFPNCRAEEKVLRFREWEKASDIKTDLVKFYSDHYSDKYMWDIAKEKYIVTKGKVLEYQS